jgi:N-acetylneuraminic acid mutarotase
VNRISLAAAELGGLLYVVGTGTQLSIYDPATDSWSAGAALPVSTNAPSVAVHNQKLYVFGGSSSDPATGGNLSDVQVYDPTGAFWNTLPNMPTNRSWSAAATFDASVFVFGGFNVSNSAVAVNEELQ